MVTWPRLADPTSFGPVLTLWDLLLLCPLSFCPRTVCCSASKRLPATACPPARLLPGHPPCPAAFCSPWAVLCCSWPQTHPPTYPPTTTGHLLGTPRKTPVPLPTLSGRPPGSDLRRRTWRFKTSTNSPAAWVGLSRVGDGDRDGDAAAVPGWAPPRPQPREQRAGCAPAPRHPPGEIRPLSRLRRRVPAPATPRPGQMCFLSRRALSERAARAGGALPRRPTAPGANPVARGTTGQPRCDARPCPAPRPGPTGKVGGAVAAGGEAARSPSNLAPPPSRPLLPLRFSPPRPVTRRWERGPLAGAGRPR